MKLSGAAAAGVALLAPVVLALATGARPQLLAGHALVIGFGVVLCVVGGALTGVFSGVLSGVLGGALPAPQSWSRLPRTTPPSSNQDRSLTAPSRARVNRSSASRSVA